MADHRFRTGSHDLPYSLTLEEFMQGGWLDSERYESPDPVAPWAARRRQALHDLLPGRRLTIAAGTFKVRSNDTDYRFRPYTPYTWLTGDQSSDGVLVMEPDGAETLYLRPRSQRDNGEFFRDRRYGELWAGRRATLGETARRLAIHTEHIDKLDPSAVIPPDPELEAILAEMRLIKDEWEIAQLEEAVAITVRGFEDVVRALPHSTSERHLEGIFWARSRLEGNEPGYHSIVAAGAHAATLHWTDNDGPLRDGDLLLLDAGAETRTLYTADITRVLPISGRFSLLQRDLYELSRKANDAALQTLRPGVPYRAFHQAAMTVLAHGLADLDILPCPAEQALSEQDGRHRRWTLCGSGHMLGMDMHDCASARAHKYLDGTLQPGHVLTVEPGVYFQPDDALIPAEMRGLGFRIEEDILITHDGYRILSHQLPREATEVESWMHRTASSACTTPTGASSPTR